MAKKTKAQSKKRPRAGAPKRVIPIQPSATKTPHRPRTTLTRPEPAASDRSQIGIGDKVTIVGVGASAGGLEAFSSMIRCRQHPASRSSSCSTWRHNTKARCRHF